MSYAPEETEEAASYLEASGVTVVEVYTNAVVVEDPVSGDHYAYLPALSEWAEHDGAVTGKRYRIDGVEAFADRFTLDESFEDAMMDIASIEDEDLEYEYDGGDWIHLEYNGDKYYYRPGGRWQGSTRNKTYSCRDAQHLYERYITE
jgi:hypothetical protein